MRSNEGALKLQSSTSREEDTVLPSKYGAHKRAFVLLDGAIADDPGTGRFSSLVSYINETSISWLIRQMDDESVTIATFPVEVGNG